MFCTAATIVGMKELDLYFVPDFHPCTMYGRLTTGVFLNKALGEITSATSSSI